jgi:hypothetical protein
VRWDADTQLNVLRDCATAPNVSVQRNQGKGDQLLDLSQIAALIHLKKRSMENYKRRKDDPLPDPDFPGGGGKRDYWQWSTIRPWLIRNSKIPIPEQFPDLSQRS